MCYKQIQCNLAKARCLGVHPWQVAFGLDSLESKLVEMKPGLPSMYEYEFFASRTHTRENESMFINWARTSSIRKIIKHRDVLTEDEVIKSFAQHHGIDYENN